jgi:CHAD domain-containing protein
MHGNRNRNPVSAEGYFMEQHSLCLKSLRAYNRKSDGETLHRFRVAIKKVKAILLMLGKLHDDFDFEKSYVPYKKIFKHAGAIREEVLYRERICGDTRNKRTKYSNAPLITRLNKKLLLASPSFLKREQHVLPIIQLNLQQLKSKRIFLYCKKLLKKTELEWRKANKHSEFHEFRKHLKQLLYCTHLVGQKEKDQMFSAKEHERIDKLQDLIGQWHDNKLLLNRILKGKVKVSTHFLQSLQHETKELVKEVNNQGNKL